MLNDFIQKTDREFDEKFELYRAKEPDGRLYGAEIYELKSFTSSKLREFAGEFEKAVKEKLHPEDEYGWCRICLGRHKCKHNIVLDSVLNLLDGVGKE